MMLEAFERSLAGIADYLDDERDAALVELGRLLAGEIDYLRDHQWINAGGKFDNVTVSQFNKVLVELGLTPLARGAFLADALELERLRDERRHAAG